MYHKGTLCLILFCVKLTTTNYPHDHSRIKNPTPNYRSSHSLRHCDQRTRQSLLSVHCILSSSGQDLSSTIKELKTHTSKQILKSIREDVESRREWMLAVFKKAAQKHKRNKSFQIWTHDNHFVELFSPAFTQQKLDYIHENPVKARIVIQPDEYLYSSPPCSLPYEMKNVD